MENLDEFILRAFWDAKLKNDKATLLDGIKAAIEAVNGEFGHCPYPDGACIAQEATNGKAS